MISIFPFKPVFVLFRLDIMMIVLQIIVVLILTRQVFVSYVDTQIFWRKYILYFPIVER